MSYDWSWSNRYDCRSCIRKKTGNYGNGGLKAIHPHPTMSEAVMEAVADAYDEVIHL